MNKIRKISSMLCALLIALTLQAQTAEFIPGQILVKLKESANAQKTSLSVQMNAKVLKNYTTLGFELWEVNQANSKQATLDLIAQYKNHPDIEFVEPNYLWEAVGGTEPNDPYFPQLWGLHNLGQDDGLEDADIDAPEAYCMEVDLEEVVVGIIDTGIDYTHEDLAENIWQNLGEDADGDGQVLVQNGNSWIFDPGDENGIDDDGNGYIDDFVGWDFAYNDNDPMDFQSHGTHCAGTIGAVINNNKGVSGVAPNVKLAAIKFLDDGGSGYTSDAIDALNYSVSMGIPISNNSWGGGAYSDALYQALQNAEANNHLFVAAAGNRNSDNDQYLYYPACYENDNVFAIASTTRNDTRSYFSNYGETTVDIGAPGSSIYSCIPNNNYGFKSGTSMATPHVAGVCAFVLGANPGSNHNTIKNTLMNSVDPLQDLNEKSVSGGRVNLNKALKEMGAPQSPCEDTPPTTCNGNDWLALKAFYDSTNGDNWFDRTGWDVHIAPHSNPPANCNLGDLYGVVLNENDRVSCIDMDGEVNCTWSGRDNNAGNNLSGEIPLQMYLLNELTHLRIAYNNLIGGIPSEIGNLNYLQQLDLRFNQLTGQIPVELMELSILRILYLSANSLSGEIPNSIGNLTNLVLLSLEMNNLSGNIPSQLANLDLAGMSLNNNQLSGCYNSNLLNWCDLGFIGNGQVSDDNNFDATWEDFCTTAAGSCGPVVSQVWPGDFDNNGTVEVEDLLYWGNAYTNTGIIRPNATISWEGQDCEDWSTEVNGVNCKNQDGNGDGTVDEDDIVALTQNLGKISSLNFSNKLTSNVQFNLIPYFNTNVSGTDNSNFEYDFFVEDESGTVSAHGISASIFFGGLNVVDAAINVSNSSLNPDEYIENFDAEKNTLHFSLTKTDGIDENLDDAVCRVIVQILEVDTGDSFALNIGKGSIIEANGTMQKVSNTTIYNANFENGTSGENVLNSSSILLNAIVSHANCQYGGSAKISAYGGSGTYSYKWNTGETNPHITDLSPGTYSVLVCDNNGNEETIEVEVQGNFIPIYDENGDIIPCNTFATCPTILDFESFIPAGIQQAERAIQTSANISNSNDIELKAGNVIRMTSGFSTGNTNFKVRIEDCE